MDEEEVRYFFSVMDDHFSVTYFSQTRARGQKIRGRFAQETETAIGTVVAYTIPPAHTQHSEHSHPRAPHI